MFPVHPRTRAALDAEGIELGPHVRPQPPLGYLDLTALASQARVILTDSGGLQKEAYWHGVPCVTLRPSTEWVDTVEAGANVLVDDDPERLVKAVAAARMPPERAAALRRRPRSREDRGRALYAYGRVRVTDESTVLTHTIAIVGAGYVGVPLAQVFADAGQLRRCSSTSRPIASTQLNRGESYIEDVPSEDLKRLVGRGRLTATTDYDSLRDVDAILIALPTPLSAQREPDLSIVLARTAEIAPRLQQGPARRARVDDLPRHDARAGAGRCSRRAGSTAGEDFHLAFSPERVDPGREDWTTQNTPKVVGGLTDECTKRAP